MKNLLYLLTILLFLGTTACNPCSKVDCGNGVCNDGDCTCNAGYEKDASGSCTIEERAKFLGNWSGVLNFSGPMSGSGNVTLNFTPGGNIEQVVINNLFTCSGISMPITATINDNMVASLNNTSCDDGAGTVITLSFSSVNWVITNNVMTCSVNYSATSGGTSLGIGSVTGTLNK